MTGKITQATVCSPFATVADDLAANGYHVIPIMQLSKTPGVFRKECWYPMRDWQRFREHPATAEQLTVWKSWPNANIGILTGTPAGKGRILAALDVDTDDLKIHAQILASLPNSPIRKIGKRGFTMFFSVPVGTKGFRTPIVELLTDTRQTVLPPSVHPQTRQPYKWEGELTLMKVRACDISNSSEELPNDPGESSPA